MRESVGATQIFSICLTFIILFTAYLAISVNYAKAFRTKSHIITMIEENEGYSDEVGERITNYLINQGYTASGDCAQMDVVRVETGETETTEYELIEPCIRFNPADTRCNACIYRRTINSSSNTAICNSVSYYKVVTFFRFDIPIISTFMNFAVRGESKALNNWNDCPM